MAADSGASFACNDKRMANNHEYLTARPKEKISNDRKKYTSDETYYGIRFENGNYTDGRGQKLNVRNLQRIRVQLDYDGAEVSFYDPEDMTHIFTHRDIFTGKLFPFLGVGNAYCAETAVIRICQSL